eukprot:TRINITY_DN74360_c1_g1_i1.p2 TRINITY_DN74360_c1_g1~~TRINITY_DN74360_c1_g1_i1.p2  ORF type:complete len:172 (+),score=30.26 TRINITY_DN74360_c1_g1_i1:62-517(+)
MVLFTVFATIDSMTLLAAMSGMVFASVKSLQCIADLEHDLVNGPDFKKRMGNYTMVMLFSVGLNSLALLPFVGQWFMAIPQLAFGGLVVARNLLGFGNIDEKRIFERAVFKKHRTWHMTCLFVHLITWFLYFVRAMMAVMDIHVHGISPYD